MNKIPLMIVGDGPAEPTGLAKIARDLAAQIVSSDLPVELVQLGGSVPPTWHGWHHYPLVRGEDWGASHAKAYYHDLFGSEPGILWVIWDPARLFHYADTGLPVQLWSYPAIDSTNLHEKLSGPAAYALHRCDRVIAYGRWASTIFKATFGKDKPISYLPHGLSTGTYSTRRTEEEQAWVRQVLGPHYREGAILVGCVATNQARKDLSLYFRALRLLRDRGYKVYGWLHTDVLVKDWAIAQLVEDCHLERQVTVTTEELSDRQLAVLYQSCAVTIAPALGEGYGYPIVESLASGTPVVHGDFAGGAELIPKLEWRVPSRGERLEGVYALRRPVFTPEDVANAAERALKWRGQVGEAVCRGYCQGVVAHLDWSQLWPRWESWIRKGLNL